MKPAAPESTAPIRKPIAAVCRKQPPGEQEDDDADDGDGRVLAGEIGLRTLADGAGDFLHARIALVGRKDRLSRPDGVEDRKQAAGDDDVKHGHCRFSLDLVRKIPSPDR